MAGLACLRARALCRAAHCMTDLTSLSQSETPEYGSLFIVSIDNFYHYNFPVRFDLNV